MELQGRYNDIKRQGLGLIAVSYDSPETLKKFSDSRGITFPMISDAGSQLHGLMQPDSYCIRSKGRHMRSAGRNFILRTPTILRSVRFT